MLAFNCTFQQQSKSNDSSHCKCVLSTGVLYSRQERLKEEKHQTAFLYLNQLKWSI